ncbi:hypothetical protein [Cellulosimicrobium phage DS1]|nr:hypothetical protein [Cellulosimicrobium phage DS1]
MSESAYYDSLGIPPGGLGSRRRAYFGGTPTDALSDNDLAYRYYLNKMPGATGTLNDLRAAYLRSLGGTGSINDMLNQLYSGVISETPNPKTPTVVDSTHNGNNGLANVSATIPAGAAVGDKVLLFAAIANTTDLGSVPAAWSVLVNSIVNTRRMVLLIADYAAGLDPVVPLAATVGAAVATVLMRDVTSTTVGTIWRRTENGGAQALIKAPGIATSALCLGFFAEASSNTPDGYTMDTGTLVTDHYNNPGPLSSGTESLVVIQQKVQGPVDINVTWNTTTSQNGQAVQVAFS